MKILVVEDDSLKREFIEYFLQSRDNIEIKSFHSVRPAIAYAIEYSNEIDGIILDLGLTSYDYSDDYDFKKGLELVEELTKKGIRIPILIYSDAYINLTKVIEEHRNVKYQMDEYDSYTLRQFVNWL